MKNRTLPMLTAAAAGALGLAGAPGEARAADPTPAACVAAASEGSAFTQNKRVCYETLAALGRYEEIVDIVELENLALKPQDKYFLGAAYFGLSNRTGASSVRCHATIRAKELLEDFLTERQALYGAQHTFGTSDDMKYTYHATRLLGALKAVTGCEESSYTPASLERYGRRYTVDRLKGLFYKTAERDALRERFEEKLGQLNDQMKGFVATAASVESRYGMNLVEIDAGRRNLFTIKDLINGSFGANAVTVAQQAVGGDESFPTFVYNATWRSQILGTIAAKTAHYTDLLLPEKRGEVAVIEAEVLAAVGSETMEAYVARKERTIIELTNLSSSLILGTNFWSAMEAPERSGRRALDAALSTPSRSTLGQKAAHVDTLWQEGMSGFCNASRPAWYCRRTP
ncbi:hypothetical protein [Sorangium sp. So ce131]|uniref:hypothetical protein n=1 Tax=Sorangium sp. So ce131 TaxID=3133282 RepID=UPI003F627A11